MKDNRRFIKSCNEKNYIFRIGEVSKMTGVSPRQLRYWEQKGYIHSERNEKMASRVFNHKNFMMVKLIKFYLDDNFSLSTSVEKAQQHLNDVEATHAFVLKMHHGLVNRNGKNMIDMGYFDKEHKKRLYGYLDDAGQVVYQVAEI
ncbi:transcriptional regulator [Fructilactobacillus lindneri]|nr:MerR family transcriptional regulator [Fructilactobacillus lindneri]ANZ57454.1 transcriptional regulator [Fructilactobacillus lindneri]ANZ58722.1 transcriptional regulator [Fructilactobacillus lindneri]POG97940.1 transcriptional regulator [Fructilactobacillus lindneri]POG99272.1 transcriptional regulator [Fructilactobacillus lindneri]POH01909.1 transcriptional regulator [Fructilactobacillus lindneri]